MELRKRRRISSSATVSVERFLNRTEGCKNVIVFTGSGLSAASGMSMFSTRNGLYERARKKFKIQDGIKLFTYSFYKQRRADVQAFFAQIYSEAQASCAAPGHHALATISGLHRIKRHYTLNIDGLAEVVGIDTWHHENNPQGVTIEMHGNIRQLVCPTCHAVEPLSRTHITTMRGLQAVPCRRCHQDEMRFKVMLYDDDQGDCITPEHVFETLEEDLEAADLVLWIGISFEQSASVEYFRRVRSILASQGRLEIVQQAIINPSDDAYFNILSSVCNIDELRVMDVRTQADTLLPLLASRMQAHAAGAPCPAMPGHSNGGVVDAMSGGAVSSPLNGHSSHQLYQGAGVGSRGERDDEQAGDGPYTSSTRAVRAAARFHANVGYGELSNSDSSSSNEGGSFEFKGSGSYSSGTDYKQAGEVQGYTGGGFPLGMGLGLELGGAVGGGAGGGLMGNVWQGDGGQGGTAASGVGLAAASAALWLQQGALAQGWTAPQALSCGSECPSIALAGLLPGAPGHLGDALQSLRAGALLAGAHGCAAAGDAPRPVGELPNIKGGSAAQSGGEVAGGGGEDQHSQAAATHALSFLLSSQFPATPAQDPPAFTLVPPLPTTNPDAPDPAPVLGAHAPAVVLQPPLNHHHQQQQQQHQHAQEQHQHQEQLQGTGQGGHTGGALESSVDAVTLVAQWMVSHSIQQPQQQPQQQQQQQQPHHQQGQQEEGQRLCLDTALKWLPQQQQQQPQPHSPQQQHHRFNHQHHHSLAQQPHGLKQEQEGQQASKQVPAG